MAARTTPLVRQRLCDRHRREETYEAIADSESLSKWTVRYWCRRERDGGSLRTVYRREPAGLLGRFDPKPEFRTLRTE